MKTEVPVLLPREPNIVPTLKYSNPVHTLTVYLFKISFIISHISTSYLELFRLDVCVIFRPSAHVVCRANRIQ